ncbi:serine protease [Microcystis panniformis]|uniref:TPR domain protein component of TonB system n=1 Tax=Microcystis panniformis FACHB-1757 TaxID=1638788 RepID=A0A0K1RX57_9CHRO|nr:serine protease [Microcystis panniformis]AKV66390.1 TPR domain protein component of TonB system [Microcystis panniformis FACHB-1757]
MIKPSIALILLFSLLPQPGLTLITPAAGNISNHPILTAQGDRELTEEQFLQRVTVRITSETNRGSGTIIAKKGDNYLVLTNAHVTRNTKTLQVQTYDGHSRAARIVPNSLSENQDLALLEFSDTREYSIATIAEFTINQNRIGLEVVAAGYVAETGQYRTTKGTLEQVSDRPLRDGYSVGYSGDIVQGMSGGGIFVEGELIGINGRSAHPILSNYIYEDGTKQPTDAEIQQMRAVNWGILLHTLLTYIRPEILSAYNLPLPPVNPDIETTAPTRYIAELEAKAKGFTVRIDSTSGGNGSGVIIAKKGNIYTVLTADHVFCEKIKGTTRCADYTYTVVTSDGKTRNIEKSTIIRQEGVDLAVFQFESLDNYPVAEIANYNPNSGDFVFAAGFPKIGQNPSKWLFSGGRIHDKEQGLLQTRQSPLSTQQGGTLQSVASLTGGYELVYTSITFGGMSGGAVLDSQGRVIGIHGSSETAGVGKIQLGFSLGIPISTFIGLQERLKVKPQLLTTAQPQVSPQQKQEISQAITGVIVPNTNAKADIWIERGGQLWRLRRYEEAIKAFDEAIKQNDPKNVYLAWYGKGLALFGLDKDQPAIEALQQAINTLPKGEDLKNFHSSILQQQSVVYRSLENYEQALTVINQAISLFPNNPKSYIIKWVVLYELKRYDEGLDTITQAIDLAPRAFWYAIRGSNYYLQKKYELALADFNKAMKLNPNYAMAYSGRGELYYYQKKYDLALADFNKAIELDSKLAITYNNRGNLYYYQQKYELALADWNKAIELDSKLAMAYSNRGNIYNDQQKYELALADWNKAIELDSKLAEAYNNRGRFYYNQQKYELALADFNKAIELDSKLAGAYSNRGGIYYNQQKYELALADFNKAIELDSKLAMAYNNRGGIYYYQQKDELALADFNKAIELDSKLAIAYYNRGSLYYLQQKYELALSDYNKAIKINKNAWFAMMGIGLVKYEQGSISEAIKQWEKALIINNQSAEIQLALAVAFYHQGEKDKALKLAESALSINSQLANIDFLKKILRTNKIFADVQKLLAHPELKNYVNQ